MGKLIDFNAFGKWLSREAIPTVLPLAVETEGQNFATTFGAHNGIDSGLVMDILTQFTEHVLSAHQSTPNPSATTAVASTGGTGSTTE